MAVKTTCETCRFSRPTNSDKDEDKGKLFCCFKVPELVVYGNDHRLVSAFPSVMAKDWCGQHEPISAKKKVRKLNFEK